MLRYQRRKMMSKKTLGIIFALVIIGGCISGWYWYKTTPAYSLNEINKAIKEGNRIKFGYYVDLDRIFDNIIDDIVAKASRSTSTQDNASLSLLGSMLGTKIFTDVTARGYKNELRSVILESVESGLADSIITIINGKKSGTRYHQLMREALHDDIEFRGLAEIQRVEDIAVTGLQLNYVLLDTMLTLEVQMGRVKNRWKVIRIHNLFGYIEEISNLRLACLEDANQRTFETMINMAMFGELRKHTDVNVRRKNGNSYYLDEYYLYDNLILKAPVKNTCPDTIISITATPLFNLYQSVYPIVLSYDGLLTPDETVDMQMTIEDYNYRNYYRARGSNGRYKKITSLGDNKLQYIAIHDPSKVVLQPSSIITTKNGITQRLAEYENWEEYAEARFAESQADI